MNRYFVQDKIGDGGYSQVFKCVDNIGIRYACKVLPKNKNKRYRVQNEIGSLKKMSISLRVPKYIDAKEDQDNYYIIQELCRGGSLKEYLENKKFYAENTVSSIIRGSLRSLYHIHEQGIIHRDIKISNIFLSDRDYDATIKIGDFGLSLHYDFDVVEVNELVGTVFYMSPESLEKKFSPKSDVWSIGIMTYKLLTGKMPFNDKYNLLNPSFTQICYSILFEEPDYKRDWNNISQDAQDFVKLCLDKSYNTRLSVFECLNHPWLIKSEYADSFSGNPLLCQPFIFEDINAQSF